MSELNHKRKAERQAPWPLVRFVAVTVMAIQIARLCTFDIDLHSKMFYVWPHLMGLTKDRQDVNVSLARVGSDPSSPWVHQMSFRIATPTGAVVPCFYNGIFERYGRGLPHCKLEIFVNGEERMLVPTTDWVTAPSPYGAYVALPPTSGQTVSFRIDERRFVPASPFGSKYPRKTQPPSPTGTWCRVVVFGGRVALPPKRVRAVWEGTAETEWVLLGD